jgi:tetratricopeptide (TPR) repeat protein
MFGWSFYANPSAEAWADALVEWVRNNLGIQVTSTVRPAAAVRELLRKVPLLLVLDGLEVMQEGPTGEGFGRLLDGTLREVLDGACQLRHSGLVVLTSRFPFADLEIFEGGRARMLEVPPFTPAEGAALLEAAGGDWLDEEERHALVRAVDGHALATGVLAGMLAARPPANALAELRTELAAAARTDARVGHVLEFYADRLGESDRYLLAAVSLFARPVETHAVLVVAGHEAFGSRLAGWTPAMVREAVRDRLSGLATWHPDGTISAHPLVRDTFRRLGMDAANTVAATTLTGLSAGRVTTREDALRVVEAIELLLDAGLWKAADDMHTSRSGNGHTWKNLPAARLGQRASLAFVVTPARRGACAARLTSSRLGFYLNSVGLLAAYAGDLAMAQDYLSMAVSHAREAENLSGLTTRLHNHAYCLSHLGLIRPAQDVAADALAQARSYGYREQVRSAHALLGRLAMMAGDAVEAERQFVVADQIEFAITGETEHLYSVDGVWWADWLSSTGRPEPAQVLTERNREISQRNGWNEDVARCDRMLGRLALRAGATLTAGTCLDAAAQCFRDGDCLIELAPLLSDLADWAQASGDLDAAELHANEAISIAAPRGLIPAHCSALSARARILTERAEAATADSDLFFQAQDAADAALRLAIRHDLPWHELDALRAHTLLGRTDGNDQGWAAKADTLFARLVSVGPDPWPGSDMQGESG